MEIRDLPDDTPDAPEDDFQRKFGRSEEEIKQDPNGMDLVCRECGETYGNHCGSDDEILCEKKEKEEEDDEGPETCGDCDREECICDSEVYKKFGTDDPGSRDTCNECGKRFRNHGDELECPCECPTCGNIHY